MQPAPTATRVLTTGAALPMADVVSMSGVTEANLRGLVDHGVLAPVAPEAETWAFDSRCVPMLQRAEQLRRDLALDAHAFALAVMFLDRITALEGALQRAASARIGSA